MITIDSDNAEEAEESDESTSFFSRISPRNEEDEEVSCEKTSSTSSTSLPSKSLMNEVKKSNEVTQSDNLTEPHEDLVIDESKSSNQSSIERTNHSKPKIKYFFESNQQQKTAKIGEINKIPSNNSEPLKLNKEEEEEKTQKVECNGFKTGLELLKEQRKFSNQRDEKMEMKKKEETEKKR